MTIFAPRSGEDTPLSHVTLIFVFLILNGKVSTVVSSILQYELTGYL